MTSAPSSKPRYARIDIARGVALLAMASYHLSWDLEFFGYLEPGTANGSFLKYYARAIASSFLFLAGMSLQWAHARFIRWPGFTIRFAKVAGAAALITVATWFFMPGAFVYFGILHAIAALSLIGLLFLRAPALLTYAAAVLAFLSPYWLGGVFETPWMLWAGLNLHPLPSNDYVPLLPWASAFLAGIATARLTSSLNLADQLFSSKEKPGFVQNAFSFAGRHSLAIYLIHQPLLIALVWCVSNILPPSAQDPTLVFRNDCQQACVVQGDKHLCERFCDCTVNELLRQGLFTQLQLGAINANKDVRIKGIAQQCMLQAQE